ncbi:aminotransferase class III-fold pyridoxal phosphate-dependent enzyme [Corallococcus sp. M34]|uniref:aminotransferase class III-fold pyridoxal phosphate-dependent enzyme n=1 Tax=Citreicoccus inhibens TaxID=2849499 RepID=UPI001C250CAB|nr:aminotransferase class III-fold pyridoxal phosphate-dependent enzyme [Citreicoccus inhibens]MBU8897142.1 aminotransferase class III-fold pyridoxal phosphate-dependent enzyme [Citreicoccus inhibens]
MHPDDLAWPDASRHFKPYLHRLLAAAGLDLAFHRAEGDFLYALDESGREVGILDLLGGYGTSLLGHNHPELLDAAHQLLREQRPFSAQASLRPRAARLAATLSERVGRVTGRTYVATFASTGTEVVEAALKHASLELLQRKASIVERLREQFRRLRLRLRAGDARLGEEVFTQASRKLGERPLATLDDLEAALLQRAAQALSAAPRVLAVEGGFHGKTLGALSLTHNPEFRVPWSPSDISPVVFLPPGDTQRPAQEAERARVEYLELEVTCEGEVRVLEAQLVNVCACFVEAVQGEGGIRVMTSEFLTALRAMADAGGFPLVLDEIQCGLGRTGTFLGSEPSGVAGDYYLFSKALGGGLAKISALLVEESRYIPEFGYLHSSTFADDDYASTLALKTLDVLARDDGALLRRCRETGQGFLESLRALQARFPQQLRDVRGVGLMIGLELAPPRESPSALLRVLSEQGLLGYVISGYLLRQHGIRVAPTLAAHGTIRLEPSAYIAPASLERFLRALEQVLVLLRDGDVGRLTGHLLDAGAEPAPESPRAEPPLPTSPPPVDPRRTRKPTRVAFLIHFSEPTDLRAWEPRLAHASDEGCARFLSRMKGLIEPFVVSRAQVQSAQGRAVDLTVIGIPFTSAQAMEALRAGEAWALESVRRGVELARREGCVVVGFGGHTSIVTDNCRALVEDELVLTSGNSLTVAAALDALFRAARQQHIPIERARLGIVGATGNIGAAMGEIAAESVGELILFGRPGAQRYLEPVAAAIYASELRRLLRGGPATGLAATVSTSLLGRSLLANPHALPVNVGEVLRRGLLEELGERAPIRIATEQDTLLRGCQLIVSATNAARPVILPAHVTDAPAVLCDIAVPQDVDASVKQQRPQALVLRGGLVRTPHGEDLRIPGARLGPGEVFGCLAETLLLGFSGQREYGSQGTLVAENIRHLGELARLHGFQFDLKPA